MMDIVPEILVLVVLFLAGAVACVWMISKSSPERKILTALVSGFTLFNGFAISSVDAPLYMITGYFIFVIFLIFGFRFGVALAKPAGDFVTGKGAAILARLAEERAARTIILIYLSLIFASLLTPTFKAHLLFAPPAPDVRAAFGACFSGDANFVTGLLDILTVLITPLYYLALYRYRRKTGRLVFLIFFPLYMIYVHDAYIGRHAILTGMFFILLFTWEFKRWQRPFLLIGVFVFAPVLGSLAYEYTFIRLGAQAAGNVGLIDGFIATVDSEIMMPIKVGVPLVEMGAKADLVGYFLWIVTLPIPGFLKAGLPVTYLNYDISAVLLGFEPGAANFFVVLPGLLAEGMYLYGSVFFFLHPLTIGMLFGVFAAILKRVPSMAGMINFLTIIAFFNLCRGGIGSALPIMVNGSVLLIFIVILSNVRWRKYR